MRSKGSRTARLQALRPTLLPLCNTALVIVCLVSIGAIGWQIMEPVTLLDLSRAAIAPMQLPEAPDPGATEMELSVFRERDIFDAEPIVVIVEDDSHLEEEARALMARLTLVGMLDGNPPQAIITDSQNDQSYFISAGETFGAGVTLEEVTSGRVKISYKGFKTDLHL